MSPGSQRVLISLITSVPPVFILIIIYVFYCKISMFKRRKPCILKRLFKRRKPAKVRELESGTNSEFITCRMDKFLNDIESQKPIRFTSHQIMRATNNYSNKLGSGAFGSVYKGTSIDGSVVAVKVLRGGISDKRMEEQFMAEVGTIGRVHHFNLVRLIGFCIEKDTAALVYEYMSNGSLDKYMFGENNKNLAFEKLHEIAVGIAKGIAYLHEECQERIIHYDIKPENILLDDDLHPKVSDFGLAKLCNREKSYITMTGLRGTPGYAAPELWRLFRVTHKCDVFSFGMLLFEIIGRRRNFDANLSESQEWFPRLVWFKFESENLEELIDDCGIRYKDMDMVKRMARIAFLCVQYRSELRPMMSVVVKMLEGSMDIPNPTNPFQHLMGEDLPTIKAAQKEVSINVVSSLQVTESSIASSSPEIDMDSIHN